LRKERQLIGGVSPHPPSRAEASLEVHRTSLREGAFNPTGRIGNTIPWDGKDLAYVLLLHDICLTTLSLHDFSRDERYCISAVRLMRRGGGRERERRKEKGREFVYPFNKKLQIRALILM
jgi:hypothetical protein